MNLASFRQGTGRFGADLTSRERFNRTMHYQQVDYVSNLEFGYWDELLEDWMAEGHLPESFRMSNGVISMRRVEEYFGIEQFEHFGPMLGAFPQREQVEIETVAGIRTKRDGLGRLIQEQAESTRTIPHFIDFPIKDRATWDAFRDEFLDVDHHRRVISEHWLRAGETVSRTTTNPVTVGFGSFIGWVRDWIGFESLAYMSMDDPDLVEEMVVHLSGMAQRLLPPILERGQFDAAGGWEDICFNGGPLLNPRFFVERIIPHMVPVMRLLRQHGVDVIWTDCDGNILKLIPLWLDIGLNCMFPLEVNAGNDPVALKKEYGRDLLVRGGFNKFALHGGREAILKELKRLEPTVADGGFIPHIDHRCPGGVSFENYRYYIYEKCHMLGWPEDRIRAAPAFDGWTH